MTASGTKLVAMLYDKAIESLNEAIRAIEAKNIQARWNANLRAQEILTHLASTLNHEQGGEIAKNLDQLYRFMLNRLLWVDLNNDAAPAQEVIGLLEPLRQSWHELADKPPNEAGATAPSDADSGKGIAVSA